MIVHPIGAFGGLHFGLALFPFVFNLVQSASFQRHLVHLIQDDFPHLVADFLMENALGSLPVQNFVIAFHCGDQDVDLLLRKVAFSRTSARGGHFSQAGTDARKSNKFVKLANLGHNRNSGIRTSAVLHSGNDSLVSYSINKKARVISNQINKGICCCCLICSNIANGLSRFANERIWTNDNKHNLTQPLFRKKTSQLFRGRFT